MADVAIRAEDLSKLYRLGPVQSIDYRTLRDNIGGMLASPFKRLGGAWRRQSTSPAAQGGGVATEFWALRDVCFEIGRGEVVGFVGRNGAGKSTLLKILSRITEPTRGRVAVYGRVGALLEVGTGFHPELSGRENIYLNGAILGMRKAEIQRKFDEIVAFAEIEQFLDTPVKFYSSGMYVRLAFAVAAHLEPEILVVDEVLAVGDAAFQRKCLNKMQDVGQQGRTVLFVSHSMPAVTRLCDRALLLDGGQVLIDGPTHQVVSAYLNNGSGITAAREWPDPERAPGGAVARLVAVRIRNSHGQIADTVDIGSPVALEMEFEVLTPGQLLLPHYRLYNDEGVHIFPIHDVDPQWRQQPRPIGRYVSTALIPGNMLSEGMIYVSAALVTLEPVTTQFYERDAVAFQVIERPGSNGARGDWAGRMDGAVRPLLEWTTQFTPR